MEHYEQQYIEESGEKKPEPAEFNCPEERDDFELKFALWLVGFNRWLCKRLEKVEEERGGFQQLVDKYRKLMQDDLRNRIMSI